jgi:hypothetical protein
LDDVDDEVRDRAALYLKVLDQEPLAEKFVKDGRPSAQNASLSFLIPENAHHHLIGRAAAFIQNLRFPSPH